MQFSCCECNFFKNCTKKHVVTYDILLIIISTAHGEAVLFLPACYFENNHTFPILEFYTVYEIAV